MEQPTTATLRRWIAALAGAGLALSACGATTRVAARPVPASPSTTATTVATTTTAPTTTVRPPAVAPTTSVPPTTRPRCAVNLAGGLAATGSASQLVVVDAPVYDTTTATVTLWQRQGGCWAAVAGPWAARVGGGGFSDHHREGDGTTPTGAYTVGSEMYGAAPDPGVHYGYHRLVCGDWWDEDPTSAAYNTFQHVVCGQQPPFGGGSEALWQEANAYPSFAVVDYNTAPVVPGAGSGIFIHADIGQATDGCVSLPLGQLDRLLEWLEPTDRPLVVMGPASEISRF